MKHFASYLVIVFTLCLSVNAVHAQNHWLWPIKGMDVGRGVICAPQQYIVEELNFGDLIVAAPEGTDVLCPAGGVILDFGVGYRKSLQESVSFHAGSDNFKQICERRYIHTA